jgi:hypothetical protein
VVAQTPDDIWQSRTDEAIAQLQVDVELLKRQMAEIMEALQKLAGGKTP